MDDLSNAYEWAKTNKFNEVEIQYATILALKILDRQCKMDYDSYNLFMSVYDGINDQVPCPFDKGVHTIINFSRGNDPIVPKSEYKEAIHNLRIAMMGNMNKPTMKAFKQLVWNSIE